jgi:RNA polymerase sigma factor (sigma-70 family)
MPGPPPSGSSIEIVIQRFGRMVMSIGRRAGLADADLDELIQGVRLRLWRTQGDEARAQTVTASYVHQAARSAAIDIVRARRTVIASASESIHLTVIADQTNQPDVQLEQRETAARIMAEVETLAPDRRAAVKLHLAGYNREEIASLLGYSAVRTRNLVHRGMTDLRTRLAEVGIAATGGS